MSNKEQDHPTWAMSGPPPQLDEPGTDIFGSFFERKDMEAITKYKADDGSEWNTPEQAARREAMIAQVDAAMSVLVPQPGNLGFDGYIQQDPEKILEAKRRLYVIANQDGVLKRSIDYRKEKFGDTDESFITDTHPSWFGRMLDGGCQPLERAYGRLYCIDEQSREWNQPYYAMNPGTGDDICINP